MSEPHLALVLIQSAFSESYLCFILMGHGSEFACEYSVERSGITKHLGPV